MCGAYLWLGGAVLCLALVALAHDCVEGHKAGGHRGRYNRERGSIQTPNKSCSSTDRINHPIPASHLAYLLSMLIGPDLDDLVVVRHGGHGT